MDKDKINEFISLFQDSIFVAIPTLSKGVIHSTQKENILALNVDASAYGAYFTVNGFANFQEGATTGRTIKNVTTLNANFLDIDLTPESKRTEADIILKELCDRGLEPTAVVLTGKGLHVYWVYTEAMVSSQQRLGEYEALQLAIIERYRERGGDPAARDAARVLRLPGSRYYGKDSGLYECDVELLHLNPLARYTPLKIAEYFRNTIKMDTRGGRGLMLLTGDTYDLSKAMNLKRGTMHHESYSLALSLLQKGKDSGSARDLYAAILSTWEQPLDWTKCWAQFENAKLFLEKDRPQLFIGDPEAQTVGIQLFSDIEMKEIVWLWEGFLAAGKPHMFTGDPGLGKSQIGVDIAARLSTGRAFPSAILSSSSSEPIGVIILSAEDDAADTIKPRLIAAGADLSKVAMLDSAILVRERGKAPMKRSLALREDSEQILKAIQTLPFKVGLIIVDPISAFLSADQDSNSNSDARGTIAQLQSTVMDRGIALFMINHVNKNVAAKSAHMRSMGSVGWNAAARATFYVFKDKDDSSRRIFSVGKMNLAPDKQKGFFYRIAVKDVTINGKGVPTPFVEWDLSSFPTLSADEYSSQPEKKKDTKADVCESELSWFMKGKGQVTSKEGLRYMKERGFTTNDVYLAARALGIIGEYGIWKEM